MKFLSQLGLLLCGAASLFSPLPVRCAPLPPSFSWNGDKQGKFITALASDGEGSVFVGTEDQGLWAYSRFEKSDFWRHQWDMGNGMRSLAENNIYSFAVDKRGRIWAGGGKEGVSVSPGWRQDLWLNYGKLNGPLGGHVPAIAVSPVSGDVWMGTEAGLSVYKDATHEWSYFTRANGLPSDQISALGFEPSGRVWVGTDCDGLAWAVPQDGFKVWHHIDGPLRAPEQAQGQGLPSAQISALVVKHDGTVCVGTPNGLAWSRDEGKNWTWARGTEWPERAKGLYHPPGEKAPPPVAPAPSPKVELASEDYVTCLSEDLYGRLWIGHRLTGWEVRDQTLRAVVRRDLAAGYVRAILPLDADVLVGTFGEGVKVAPLVAANEKTPFPVKENPYLKPRLNPSPAPWPASASNPTTKQLRALLSPPDAKPTPLRAGEGFTLDDDWQTQGDWFGRYGRGVGKLCAMQTIADDTIGQPDYTIEGQNGPHQTSDDGMRRWVDRERWDDPRVLYNPSLGYRREAEWDDHGETYPMAHEGPDVWVKVAVPEGTYRLSVYFFNKDGHIGPNRWRDYLLELKGQSKDVSEAYQAPTIARARVREFWGGVYKRFEIQGPHTYWLRIGRNGSFNTLVNGVFIDKISAPGPIDFLPLVFTGNIDILPPSFLPSDEENVPLKAKPLWRAALDVTQQADARVATRQSVLSDHKNRLFALRALMNRKLAPLRTAAWRWKLPLWTEEDRLLTSQRYELAWKEHLALNGKS